LQQKYQNQIARTRMFEQQLQAEIATQSELAAITTPKFQQANELNGDIDRLNGRLNSIRERIANLELETSSPGSVHLFSPAYTPLTPDSTKARKLMLVLFPLCFCLGLAAAVARDTLDLRVFTGEDVERSIGLPPIGILFNREEVSEEVSQEYIFRIAASLDHAVRSSKIKSFAFTSVKPGGGTSTLVNLVAMEMAQLGSRVLVLDASGEREPVAYLPPEQDDPDTNPKARLLHPELGAYLHSRGRLLPSVSTVTQAFRNVHGDYDALLLDCQPLFISADTEYLVRVSDATVLIVESGKVLKHDLIRAARLLERLHIPGLAIALNKLALSHADAPLREDLRDYITLGRGFARNKAIPLTSTRFDDAPPPDETQSS
jgi:succinoglycan biosynthesis transport protein ExoP